LLAFFLGSRCLAAFQQVRALRVLESLPRRPGFACPSCQTPPPAAPVWRCEGCGNTFDAFLNDAVCPHCRRPLPAISCVECGTSHPIESWKTNVRPEPRSNSPFIDI
jgi:DNA-directed RNA polymerase subunit RPC12/RpoP